MMESQTKRGKKAEREREREGGREGVKEQEWGEGRAGREKQKGKKRKKTGSEREKKSTKPIRPDFRHCYCERKGERKEHTHTHSDLSTSLYIQCNTPAHAKMQRLCTGSQYLHTHSYFNPLPCRFRGPVCDQAASDGKNTHRKQYNY